ncbi:MAG: hypothetical protein MZV70_64520 [Desulfobacterales bacterium]|nr:hypothetical protein [Desulfobacterales bacterium]
MDKTIAFFENMGKTRLTEDFNKKVWYRGFVDFIAEEQIFCQAAHAPGSMPAATRTAAGTRPATASTASCWPSTGWATGTASR